MNEEKMPSNPDEFLEDLDRSAIRAREIFKKYGLDDNLMQEIIWNVEGEVLLKYDDRRLALEVFSKMDSVRQEGIRSNLMTRIEEQKKAIEMFEKGEMPDHESNPSIESLKKVLDEYLEFAEDLGQRDQ